MDLFVLNEDLEVESIVDAYNSLIWTDRYNTAGDFEIYTSISEDILSRIKQDYYLSRNDSEHVMIVEKILISSDAETGNMVTISGRSLESILDRRVVWGQKALTGNLQDGVKALLDENVISPSNTNRKIDNFIFEASTDPAITELKIDAQYTGDNLYDVICSLCSEKDIGFKVTLNADKKFVFKLYAGVDRSYEQTANPYVVFSPNFDNLISGNYVESKSSMKNVTLVGGEGEGSERRYTAVGNPSGLNRREMFTDARDISSDCDEDITESFDFTTYASRAFNISTNGYVEDSNFNSARVDISAYIGRTIRVSVPKYNNASGAVPSYGVAFLNSAGAVVSSKAWEKYSDSAKNKGSLTSYDLVIPTDAKFIVATMFSQAAIDADVYYGEMDDFECSTIKLSNDEYIAQLRQRGKEKLSENTEIISFEGQAETTVMFRYGEDFFNGDIVQIADGYGHETKARIMELVTSDDEEGYSVYPTFSTITNDGLPAGYLKLTYIESTGTQWIDTGYSFPRGFRFVGSVLCTNNTGSHQTIIGAHSDAPEYLRNYLSWDHDNTWNFGFYYNVILGSFEANVKYNIDACNISGNIYLKINDVYQGISSQADGGFSERSPNTMTLFATHWSPNYTSPSNMRLYSCQLYDGDLLVRDFIPCKNDQDVVGLYDLVEQKFYKNSGTGAFLVG